MKISSTFLFPLFIIGLTLYSCDIKNNSEVVIGEDKITEFDLNAAKIIIQEKTQKFTQAHITKDTAYLNNTFTEDGKVFPPNAKIVTGRKAISQLNADWVNYGIYEFKEETAAFYGNEDYLIDEGSYYLRYGEDNTIEKGKYVTVWKNDNGEWKIFSNIWNSDAPMEQTEFE